LVITHIDDMARMNRVRMCVAYELGGRISARLPVPANPVDLDAQRRLTDSLFRTMPEYDDVARRRFPRGRRQRLGYEPKFSKSFAE
jgi:hypothetical protein